MKTTNNKTTKKLSVKKKKKENCVSGTKKKVYQYDPNLELIAIYDSIAEAARFVGVDPGTIRRNIKEENKSRFYIWSGKLL